MASRILAGRYDLKEKIGEGGMSVVFRAQDMVLNRFVAVKILRPEYTKDEHFINSFRRESQIAASIVDPNIVNVYDVGREGNIYFIVMELVEGLPLSEIIRNDGPLEPRRAVNIARQIAMALSTAHKHHLIHRDVKPHNVLISVDDVAKIADFGIAKQVATDTLVGEQKEAVMGSIHYFSPEQARGNGVDERSDIYSLGVVLYEMVTGKVPFDGETAVEVAVKHISEPMVPPSRLNPSIPQDIEDIIMKATAKSPSNRYNNADEMITDLSFVKLTRLSNYAQELEEQNDVEGSSENGKIDINSIFDAPLEDDEPNGFALPFFKKNKANNAPKKARVKKTDDGTAGVATKRKIDLQKLAAVILAIILAIPVSGAVYNAIYNREPKVQELQLQSFVGMTLDEANEAASQWNFTFEVEMEINSDTYDPGVIVSQTPSADAVVKAGTEIKVVVSKGKNDGTVPKVVGKSQTVKRPNAQKIIEAYQYKLGTITYVSSKDFDAGLVVSQNPAAGKQAAPGTKINLVVSTGPSEEGNETGSAIVEGDNVKVNIPSGTAVSKMGEILSDAGLCDSAQAFVDKVKELKLDTKLRSGEYTIPLNATLEEVVNIIAHVK